jgi:hypothetical protein
MVASAIKLPLLFFLTLLVTFPSLYVFSALAGSRLSLGSVWRLLLAALGVMVAVMASLGPIILFFGASTESYPFMKLLNVAAASVGGGLGLAFLLRTLHRLVSAGDVQRQARAADTGHQREDDEPEQAESVVKSTAGPASRRAADELELGPLARTGPTASRARIVFQVWVLVFAVVGAQMSWVLRPFIGAPSLPFAWFRSRQSNFFLDVAQTVIELFGG